MEKQQFIEKVGAYAASACGLQPGQRLLATVSGGADSVALLVCLHTLGYECVAAHCNFHLRGDESYRDERHVRELCAHLGLRLEVTDFDVPAYMASKGVSVEMACRELRYAWFRRLKAALGCAAIAVAHHSDDAVETFFLNALRGSGVAGLASILPVSGDVVRPLLCVRRAEVEAFLADAGIHYVVDSSNLQNDYKRNRVRNVVMPAVRICFADADAGLQRTVSSMRSCSELYHELVDRACHDVCRTGDDGVTRIDKRHLSAYGHRAALLYEMVKTYGFNSGQAAGMVEALPLTGKRFLSADHTATIERDCIEIVAREAHAGKSHYELELVRGEDGHVRLLCEAPVRVTVEAVTGRFSRDGVDGRDVACFSTQLIGKPLVLRHPGNGDRIRPFGLHGSKLLSDLFTDMKTPHSARERAWVMACGHEILWVMGYRASSSLSVRKTDCEYIKLTYDSKHTK